MLLDEVAVGNPILNALWYWMMRRETCTRHLRRAHNVRLRLDTKGLGKSGRGVHILEKVPGQVDSTYCLR